MQTETIGTVIIREREGFLRFSRPLRVITAEGPEGVLPALREVEREVEEKGRTAAGFISYEAAIAFDRAFRVRRAGADFPLLWFGVYGAAEPFDLPAPDPGFTPPSAWTPSVSRAEYDAAIARIRADIAAGETYQVNYTMRLAAPFAGSDLELFKHLVRAQNCLYAAYADTGRFAVCSASPELFFERDLAGLVTTRPMKGTAPRGRTTEEDGRLAAWLKASEKNRAENVMIVDMLRNDLGRLAETGSVAVPELFCVERYPTVLQMVTGVTARVRAPLSELMAALFPCASITGAPKVNTMRIIAELETTPRGVYTGAMGWFAPGGRARFSVAIRTVTVDRAEKTAEYGVGGGIVWDSEAANEYEECRIKAAVLTRPRPDFRLLETLLWEPGPGWFLLEEHLSRILDSAAYFGFRADRKAIVEALEAAAAGFSGGGRRVRLLVTEKGGIEISDAPAPAPSEEPTRLAFSPVHVDSSDPFLYHKTTLREVYEKALLAARSISPEAQDAILENERGEVTETTIANLVAEKDGLLFTPPVSCGLLPGSMRARLLAEGKVSERVLSRDFLASADALYIINSVRRMRRAVLVKRPGERSHEQANQWSEP